MEFTLINYFLQLCITTIYRTIYIMDAFIPGIGGKGGLYECFIYTMSQALFQNGCYNDAFEI